MARNLFGPFATDAYACELTSIRVYCSSCDAAGGHDPDDVQEKPLFQDTLFADRLDRFIYNGTRI